MINFYVVCIFFAFEVIILFIEPRMSSGLDGSVELRNREKKLIIVSQIIVVFLYIITYIVNPSGFTRVFILNLIVILKSILLLFVFPIFNHLYLKRTIRKKALDILMQMTLEQTRKPDFKSFRDELIFVRDTSISVKELRLIYTRYLDIDGIDENQKKSI